MNADRSDFRSLGDFGSLERGSTTHRELNSTQVSLSPFHANTAANASNTTPHAIDTIFSARSLAILRPALAPREMPANQHALPAKMPRTRIGPSPAGVADSAAPPIASHDRIVAGLIAGSAMPAVYDRHTLADPRSGLPVRSMRLRSAPQPMRASKIAPAAYNATRSHGAATSSGATPR